MGPEAGRPLLLLRPRPGRALLGPGGLRPRLRPRREAVRLAQHVVLLVHRPQLVELHLQLGLLQLDPALVEQRPVQLDHGVQGLELHLRVHVLRRPRELLQRLGEEPRELQRRVRRGPSSPPTARSDLLHAPAPAHAGHAAALCLRLRRPRRATSVGAGRGPLGGRGPPRAGPGPTAGGHEGADVYGLDGAPGGVVHAGRQGELRPRHLVHPHLAPLPALPALPPPPPAPRHLLRHPRRQALPHAVPHVAQQPQPPLPLPCRGRALRGLAPGRPPRPTGRRPPAARQRPEGEGEEREQQRGRSRARAEGGGPRARVPDPGGEPPGPAGRRRGRRLHPGAASSVAPGRGLRPLLVLVPEVFSGSGRGNADLFDFTTTDLVVVLHRGRGRGRLSSLT